MVIFEPEGIFVFFTVERKYLPSLSQNLVSLGKQLKNLLVETKGRLPCACRHSFLAELLAEV